MNLLFDALLAGRESDLRPFLKLANGEVWNYSQTLEISGRIANVLAGLGAKPGDRVAAQVGKSAEALCLYLACVRAGLVYLPLNTAYTATELDYLVGNAEPAVLVCDGRRKEDLAPVAEKFDAVLISLNTDSSGELMEAARAASEEFDPVARNGDDLAAILYTSGTTGRSKGAMLTHSNLLSNAQALADYWQFSEDDVLLHALPIFHTHGLFVATNVALVTGSSMIFLERFGTEEMVRNLPRSTVMMGVPTFYTRLLECDDFTRELVQHMRLFVSGSAPMLAETHAAFRERTGNPILERYGMTETNMITSNPYDGERRPSSVGFPLPGVEVRISDPETGDPVADGGIGGIEVRGPNVFSGYWRMPEKTAEEFRSDSFFITGDLGLIDPDGYVHIVGRAKDLIISGGYNIYPKEIEAEIDQIDGVVESAVFGVPHPDFGEGVVATLVVTPGAQLSESEIVAALQGKLARFKQPKRVLFSTELPRNAMGKVQKKALRDQNAGIFG